MERRLVLDAARRAFAERGFDGASLEGIAQAAGVARPSVYEQFGTKDALIAATVADACELMTGCLADAFSAPGGVPWQQVVRGSFEATFSLVEQHPDAVTVLLLAERREALGPGSGLGGARRRVLAELARRSRERWEQLGVRTGPSAEIVAVMLYAMGEAVARRQLAGGLDKEALIELLTVFTNGGLLALWEHDFEHLHALDGPPSG